MATLTKSDIAALSVEQRLALIDDLWESIEGPLGSIEPPDWHRPIVEARLEVAQRNPGSSIPWEVVRAEMAEKWLR